MILGVLIQLHVDLIWNGEGGCTHAVSPVIESTVELGSPVFWNPCDIVTHFWYDLVYMVQPMSLVTLTQSADDVLNRLRLIMMDDGFYKITSFFATVCRTLLLAQISVLLNACIRLLVIQGIIQITVLLGIIIAITGKGKMVLRLYHLNNGNLYTMRWCCLEIAHW